MRNQIIMAALGGLAVVGFSSCSSTSTASSPKVMSKERAKQIATTSGDFGKSKSTNGFHPAPANVALLEKAANLPKDKFGMPTYDDETTHRYVRTTAYSCAENEPGAVGSLNAAGSRLKYTNRVRSAAADWSKYPLGTKFKIKGLPYTYVVDDYGSALTGTNTIDIYHPTLSGMRRWGTRPAEIDIIQMGSYERSLSLLKGRRGYWHCKACMMVRLRRFPKHALPLLLTVRKSRRVD